MMPNAVLLLETQWRGVLSSDVVSFFLDLFSIVANETNELRGETSTVAGSYSMVRQRIPRLWLCLSCQSFPITGSSATLPASPFLNAIEEF